jgi:hypothetical protein
VDLAAFSLKKMATVRIIGTLFLGLTNATVSSFLFPLEFPDELVHGSAETEAAGRTMHCNLGVFFAEDEMFHCSE